MFYCMKETLVVCDKEELLGNKKPFIALISSQEFEQHKDLLEMEPEFDFPLDHLSMSSIQVNYDCMTGSIVVPTLSKSTESTPTTFDFVITSRGFWVVDDRGLGQHIIDGIKTSKKWKHPSFERLIYDFMEGILSDDLAILQQYELEMDHIESDIIKGETDEVLEKMSKLRSHLLDLDMYYEQLVDIGTELCENENNFFQEKNLHLFRSFVERVNRLISLVSSLRDHTSQVRDLYQSQLSVERNQNMDYLTVISSIFLPLTLITGWFGMNFRYMPSLEKTWSYPALIVLCVGIVAVLLVYFKKHKWL